METILLLSATCINEYNDDAPSMAVITISDSIRDDITRLSNLMRVHGIHSITQPCYNSEWYGDYLEDDIITKENIKSFQESNESVRVDGDGFKLVCYGDIVEISFEVFPKHCGDSDLIVTNAININDLLGDKEVIVSLF